MTVAVTSRRAVFLDRDGVLNRVIVRDGRPYPPVTPDELELLPGVAEACATLRQAGCRLIVVTNQPDIARGSQTVAGLEVLHQRLRGLVGVDDIRVCPHDDADQCECRKPRPGLLLDAARDWDIDRGCSFMVGDRWRDVDAGRAAGCITIHIDYGYAEPQPGQPDFVVASLPEAANIILQRIEKEEADGPATRRL